MNVSLNEQAQGAGPIPPNTSAYARCLLVRLALGAVVSESHTLRSTLSNPKYQALLCEYEETLADLRNTLDGRGGLHDILEIAAMLRSTADRFEVAHDQMGGVGPED